MHQKLPMIILPQMKKSTKHGIALTTDSGLHGTMSFRTSIIVGTSVRGFVLLLLFVVLIPVNA
jgi:hypothetical protein